ncbi:type VI secretion system baseplate subunit TssK [Colwellia sp. D2M02]|uniref:type VI secretion system baseplate subunit TssK n=1 Tax=Colwellia sp. D2M02 TaxID=2841562 RepID=UPI001C09EBD6|nr:type VI secretion system baseplate subunit TssK [Colwellia sp. D2M02]MBU2894373.1 type VI secretion system baseplate subunit TssK [Colwellia sp. D2M02]
MSLALGRKPVWAEGVLLGQQHLQVFDEYQEYLHAQRQFIQSPIAYGFKRISIDNTALSRGEIDVLQLEFVLETGRYIAFNRSFNQQLTLTLPQNSSTVTVYVGLASNNASSGISGYNNTGQLSAYEAEYIDVNDQHDSSRTREVMVAQPKLTLFTDTDTTTYFDVLPLFQIVRGPDGHFALNEKFIPPLLDISASIYLNELLNRTNNLVNAKANVLLSRRQGLGAVTDFGPNEMNSFLLLSGMLPSAKMLSHLKQLVNVHPERLYSEFTQLLSRISLFEHSQLIDSLPTYQHNNLTEVFAQFEQMITQLLDGVVPKKMSGLKLEKMSDALYQVATIDSAQLSNNDFYLAVYFESSDSKWIDTFGEQVKIGSVDKIDIIVSSALNGLSVSHCQRTPNKLAVKSGYEYFRLESHGHIWQQIVEEQSLAVFVPYSLQKANVEIVIVDKN